MGDQECTVDSILLDRQAAAGVMEAALTKLLAVLPKVEELPPVSFQPLPRRHRIRRRPPVRPPHPG